MTQVERRRRTAEADELCSAALTKALDGADDTGVALVAVGGYGRLELAPTDPNDGRKRAAIGCYPSQLLALEDDWHISAKLTAPEQFWNLAPPPEGWEGIAGDWTT